MNRRKFIKQAAGGTAALLFSTAGRTVSGRQERDVPIQKKIGQMVMVGFRGLVVDESHPIVKDIRNLHIGGVVLFDIDVKNKSNLRNIQSPAQVKILIASLQAVSDIPLLIAVDYEGGIVNRLKEKYGFPYTVSAQYLGEKNDIALTRKYASEMAETLSRLGINHNLAPVVDLNINPDNPIIGKKERSFSSDPNVVTRHALEFMKALHERGILCTLKHFPGHGSSAEDSHLGMVDVTRSWSPSELEPYATLINAGLADAIMTAHVFHARLDPAFPATLSKPIITGILRKKLQYRGVVMTDDMRMKAISDEYGLETAVRRAVEAGVDILTFANNSELEETMAHRVVTMIQRWIDDGTIEKGRIDESYDRIMRMKKNLMKPSQLESDFT
ncbi:MAG: glycoside hydrolase family 3 N-terminal domain-containing protein [bacterium]